MTRRARTSRNRRNAALDGFTLVELVIVIAIMAIGLAAILPAFASLVDSAAYSAAVNRTTATLGRARALAIETGNQTAVAFLYDLETERCTLVVLQLDSRAASLTGAGNATTDPGGGTAFAFRPAAGVAPVQLPQGTGVYGLSFAHDGWQPNLPGSVTATELAPLNNERFRLWYPGERFAYHAEARVENNWLFPRNDIRLFLESINGEAIPSYQTLHETGGLSNPQVFRYADSFFIRFNADGSIVPSVDIGSTNSRRNAYLEYPDLPFDPNPPSGQPDDPNRPPLDQPDEFDPHIFFDSGGEFVLNPEVHLRSVDQLAVVNLGALAAETGIRSPAFVRASSAGPDVYPFPALQPDDPKSRFIRDEYVAQVSRWIDRNAEILTFNRFTGQILRKRAGQ